MSRFAVLFVLIALGTMLTLEYKRLTIKPWPAAHFDDPVDHFKYGSIGAEVNGYPYLIWRELPDIFKDRVPGGFKQFGFIVEDGHDLPIGVSVRRYGVNRVGFNCATCHTTQIGYQGKAQLVLGAPANQLDLQAYIRFLAEVTKDPRLTANAVFESAERNSRPFNWLNKLVFKYVVFDRLDEAVAGLGTRLAWMSVRPDHGPGRTDAGNFWRARWGLHPERDRIVGIVDYPSIWNQRIRENGWFHWDGNNSSLKERNISAALAGGAAEWLFEHRSVGRVSDWLTDLPAPKYPGSIDTAKARRGGEVYQRECCYRCHDAGAPQLGQVTDLSLLKTDGDRADLFSAQMVRYFSDVGKGYSYRFFHYRATNGYTNMPLDGIWARGPYLHNGSVPTLVDLLEPADKRPKTFKNGCATLDIIKVGYACSEGFSFDTSLRGNGSGGHEYGTGLTPDEKAALVEHMKTL